MKSQAISPRQMNGALACLPLLALCALGCSSDISGPNSSGMFFSEAPGSASSGAPGAGPQGGAVVPGMPGSAAMPGATGSGAPGAAPGGQATPGGTTPAGTAAPPRDSSGAACIGEEVLVGKRLIRLTFNQVANSLGALLGEEFAESVRTGFELPSPLERTFPPLNNPREGSVVIDSQWQTGDSIAQRAGSYVAANFSTVTQCGEQPTEECARSFVGDFVERAFRRPLQGDELASLLVIFDTVRQGGGTVQQATEYSVYGALSAPQFLYRTEFGTDALAAGALDPFETASMLSYFIADGPPDAPLLEAAAAGALSSPDQLAIQVDRLLQTPQARINLQAAMYSYFGIETLRTIVIDPGVAPQFNEGLRASMMHETELFLNDTLWNGTIEDLMLSRESFVNEGLANLYGVDFPPAGAAMDEDGFARVTLPDNRSGILTQPGFLTTRSSPDEPSVVRRGLLVNASLLCSENPTFPEQQADEIDEIIATQTELSEREKADYRMTTIDCMGCHLVFDPYGLALDNFDVIGAYRAEDHEGRPIDASVTLPPPAGGATVTTPVQMARELVSGGAFNTCVAKNLIAYALSEASTIGASSCATRRVVEGFASTDQSFSALVREVAKSTTFTNRTSGDAQ